jgi:hypothetical protein
MSSSVLDVAPSNEVPGQLRHDGRDLVRDV